MHWSHAKIYRFRVLFSAPRYLPIWYCELLQKQFFLWICIFKQFCNETVAVNCYHVTYTIDGFRSNWCYCQARVEILFFTLIVRTFSMQNCKFSYPHLIKYHIWVHPKVCFTWKYYIYVFIKYISSCSRNFVDIHRNCA